MAGSPRDSQVLGLASSFLVSLEDIIGTSRPAWWGSGASAKANMRDALRGRSKPPVVPWCAAAGPPTASVCWRGLWEGGLAVCDTSLEVVCFLLGSLGLLSSRKCERQTAVYE